VIGLGASECGDCDGIGHACASDKCGLLLHVSPRSTAYSIHISVFLSSMINIATLTAHRVDSQH